MTTQQMAKMKGTVTYLKRNPEWNEANSTRVAKMTTEVEADGSCSTSLLTSKGSGGMLARICSIFSIGSLALTLSMWGWRIGVIAFMEAFYLAWQSVCARVFGWYGLMTRRILGCGDQRKSRPSFVY
ncbi:hypothetical protein B0I72DRAFT_24747 [Yarrowia lipolytica]|uniref:Uncharacterized protein n=1 Tax=Yarrowia lipolytica TaxID=4952 RepID=A0A371CBL5_YARLL|nr:hypothetical protein BKA91DRAFT_10764 [Yarrowia lipolytica]KAE8172705.1 hypothetical protein BKA90DRAFT_15706 [Yarrowia lipolytica]RDW27490.1 hypothetical protein B0I71DRAFT_20669 [Yarrowia lipolytica]RDW33850.1 hypothetical protein B0I72DRAFT_24747 [Yarrowia lipolytica]RDW38114.1 hypothetical protein B0I73DRAFT_47871 [Yarrowia lipolytica]